MELQKWNVLCEPQGENPDGDGKNACGLVVYITNGTIRNEVSRVLFVRRSSKNPRTTFKKMLKEQIDVAEEAARVANDLIDQALEARREAEEANRNMRRAAGEEPELV